MKLNSEISTTTNTTITSQTYILKLKKSFQLILNDLPDNRDDTINAKLLDSLKQQIINNDKDLVKFIRSYLLDEIIDNDKFKTNISTKESEVVQFFIDLVTIYLQNLSDFDRDFLKRTLNFLKVYFESHFNTQFLSESIISCSILNLIIIIYDLVNNSSSGDIDLNLINNIILDKFLLTHESLIIHLHTDCKSVFVRKLYKKLLNKHLIYLINNLHNKSTQIKERLEFLISSISLMSYEIKLNNLDIHSNLIQNYFILNTADKSNEFKQVHELFNFNDEKANYLNNLISFTNDASIEAFTYIYAFNLIITYTNKDDQDLFHIMCNDLNEIAHDLIQKTLSCHASFKQSLFKKEIDHLFKFLIYFYSFLEQFKPISLFEFLNSKLDFSQFEINLIKVKLFIKRLILMPFCLNTKQNEFTCDHYDVYDDLHSKNYCDSISEFTIKSLILKQCLINLKLFVRKFQHLNLFQFITSKQVIYILRHLDLDLDTKNKLLDILVDSYSSMSRTTTITRSSTCCSCLNDYNMINLVQLIDSFCELFHLKLNDYTLNDNMLKLITIHFEFNTTNNNSLNDKIIHIIHGHLNTNDNLNVVLSFLTSLLSKSFTHLVVTILNSNNFQLLTKCANLVVVKADSDDSLNESKDTIFQFYKSLFINLRRAKLKPEFLTLFNDEFIQINENDCFKETEAFMRRELVQFLISFYRYKQEINESMNLVSTSNFLSSLLVNDFDWQIQLFCLDYFDSVLNQLDSNIISTVLFESNFLKSLFTSLNDSDQHVINASAKLLLTIKNKYNDLVKINNTHEYSLKVLTTNLDDLNSLIKISNQTSDLYTLNPAGILDDIISSYQFEIDDEKFIDCY